MKYLQILCPVEEVSRHTSLKSVMVQHYHVVVILMALDLGELFCYCGFRVTSEEITRCESRLRRWVHEQGAQARQVVLHAGRLFGFTRLSNRRGYFEARAFMIACQTLWIYGEMARPGLTSIGGVPQGQGGESEVTVVRLDQYDQNDQAWIVDGATMRPYLAGVGCILDKDGVTRLIQEGTRVLRDTRTWGFAPVMAKALKVWHQLRSNGTSLDLR
jgi:hypothetical protein